MATKYYKTPLATLFAVLLFCAAHAQDDGRLIKIPVIFHVLYKDSTADNGINPESRNNGNSSAYLTRAKLEAELKDLDLDFQKLDPDTALVIDEYKNVIGNPKVHFYLDSIIYVKVPRWRVLPTTNTGYLHKFSPAIRPQDCLNVYTGVIYDGLNGTEGLTPVRVSATGDSTDDCVNLDYLWVGLHYRLLSHETGH